MTESKQELLTIPELAEYLKVSQATALKKRPKDDKVAPPTDESENDSTQELPFDNKNV